MSLQLAAKAFNAGDIRAANQICEQVLANDPTNPDAMNLMGAISGSQGRHDLAAEWMRKAVEKQPRELSYRTNYLAALLRINRPEDATKHVDESLSLFPGNADLLTLQGVALGQSGKDDAAIKSLEKAIEANPHSSNAHFNLAVIYRRKGEQKRSIELLQKAVELDPKNASATNDLAGSLLDEGKFIESMRHLQTFLKLRPRSAQGYYNLSVAMEATGDLGQSIVCLRNAYKLDPSLRMVRSKLINQLSTRGEFDEAGLLLDAWQREDPENPGMLATQAKFFERQGKTAEARDVLERVLEKDRQLPIVRLCEAGLLEVEGKPEEAANVLEEVVAQREVDALESMGIRFQIGKIYDKIKKYDKAFESYRSGNEMRKEGLPRPFHAERNTTHFQDVKKAFVDGFRRHVPKSGFPSDVPIFILGMPRSGTSLMEQILGSHSQIHPAGELRKFSETVKGTHSEDSEGVAAGGFTILENELEESPIIPADFGPALLKKIGKEYVDHVTTLANGQRHVSDKMPFNFLFAPLIRMALPNAKIIHTRRNPLDTSLSCYFQNFGAGIDFSFDLEDTATYYRNYQSVMQAWRELDINMLEVDYEELVSDTEPMVRKILDYCGLELEPACLESHKSERVVATASYQQVREPIYDRSIDRWKNYEKHIQPLIDALGEKQAPIR